MAKIRQDVSGNSADDSIKQQSSELKGSSKTMKEKLLQAAGMERPAISNKQSSAWRTKLGLSWNKYPKHRKFLKSIRVIVPSEHRERVFQDSVVCGGVETVNKSMESQDKAERVPAGYVGREDLTGFVSALLDQYEEVKQLSGHDGAIPQNEIFIKVGGDHDGAIPQNEIFIKVGGDHGGDSFSSCYSLETSTNTSN